LQNRKRHTREISHVVINYNALCGNNPGYHSGGWSDYDDKEITCPKCKKKLDKMLMEQEED